MSREITLLVPQLTTRAVIGGSCCAVPAAEAVEQTLAEWPGVERVVVGQGRVDVVIDDASRLGAADLVWSLRMLGLEATAIETPCGKVLI
ncbi:MAG: hypothetical protein WD689_01235 [Gaiellaceae bacterium]